MINENLTVLNTTSFFANTYYTNPLLFIVFELEISNDIKLGSPDNTEIGLFDANSVLDIVDYSPEYTSYIKNF